MRRIVLVLVGLLLVPTAASSQEDAYQVTVDLEPRIRSLANEDSFEREPAEALFAALGEQAVPPLAAALEREDDEAVRIGVIDVLVSLEVDGVAPLLVRRARVDASDRVRAAAISALILREDEAAGEVVPAALQSEDPVFHRVAVDGCPRHCGSPEQMERLVRLTFREPVTKMGAPRGALVRAIADPHHREAAAAAIERVAGPRLTGEDDESRLRAAVLFGDLGDPRALESLEIALDQEQAPLLRVQAILALGTVGNAGTVEKLVRALDTLPKAIRPAGCKALRALDRRRVPGAADAARRGCP